MLGEGGSCLNITIGLAPDEGRLSPPLEDPASILVSNPSVLESGRAHHCRLLVLLGTALVQMVRCK